MKALSLIEPIAYLSGCLLGDAWLTTGLCMRVADRDFAEAFAAAIVAGYGVAAMAKLDERGYWLVRKHNGWGRFNQLRSYVPTSHQEIAAWLRGLFDSEGNVVCVPNPTMGARSWNRRVAMFSTNTTTLTRASESLRHLNISSRIVPWTISAGHKGTKPVFAVLLKSERQNFLSFATLIGSSIERKRIALDLIPTTYQHDLGQVRRELQLLGAKAKHKKTMEITLPKVVAGIELLIQSGTKPTQRNCRVVPGYDSIQRHVAQGDLVAMALKGYL